MIAERNLKYHELEALQLIEKNLHKNEKMHFLDLGCADGLFLEELCKQYPQASLIGVELNKQLSTIAQKRLLKMKNVKIVQENVMKFYNKHKFDLIVASGIMTIFENPFAFLDKYTGMLSENGILVIFGRFNSFPINSKFMIKHIGSNEWVEPRVSFHTGEISDYLATKNYATHFQKFDLPIDLPKKDNPFASYTVKLATGENLVICGANVVIESFHCIVKQANYR